MTCSYPGCVAIVEAGGACPAHRSKLGKVCAGCRGSGHTARFNEVTGQQELGACGPCCGTGRADAKVHQPRRRPDDDPVDKRDLMGLMQP